MKVGIAGAGLMGRLLAWRLCQDNITVTLFDAGSEIGEKSAAFNAAGLLSPVAELEQADTHIYRIGIESLSRWPEILSQLPDPVFFEQKGSVVVAHQADRPLLDQLFYHLKAKMPDVAMAFWDNVALQKNMPELRFNNALYFPNEGHIDAKNLLHALYRGLTTKSVTCYWHHPVMTLTPGVIHTATDRYCFDWVVDCRGMGACEAWPDLRAVRGEIIYVEAPEVQLPYPVRLLHPRYRLYIAPRQNHQYVIGATEIEADDDSPISVRSSLELLSAAYSVHTGFAEARVMAMQVGRRPALPDHLPKIQYEPRKIAVNGLYRHGFLIAPVLIEEIYRHLQLATQEIT